MAADATAGELVLYGGEDVPRRTPADPFAFDTWIFRGCTWQRYSGSGPTLSVASMATSPRNGGVLLFGLPNSGRMQTWTWSHESWTQVQTAPEQTPPGRFSGAMSLDPVSGKVVLYGGFFQSVPDFGTWSWDGAAWSMAATSEHPDITRGAMAADAAVGVLFAGESSWLFRGGTWQRVVGPDPVHVSGVAVDDPLRRQVLSVGGYVNGSGGTRIDAYAVDGWSLVSN